MNKVHGGTPRGSTSLCVTCRNAHRIVGINMQSEIRCTMLSQSPTIRFPVAECSGYDDKRIPALHEMRDIAWTVESRNRGPVGFGDGYQELRLVSPAERRIATPDQPAAPTAETESYRK